LAYFLLYHLRMFEGINMNEQVSYRAFNKKPNVTILHSLPQNYNTQIIAVGGGKGGVGKTSFTVILGLSLVNLKKKVVVVDTDFGSPSLNNFLHSSAPQKSIKDFILKENEDINSVIEDTSIPNLKFISGSSGVLGMSEYCYRKSQILIENLKKINADYVILDLGTGITSEIVNLFLAADEQLLIANPNPVSIFESFKFLRLSHFEQLKSFFKNDPGLLELVRAAFNSYDYDKYQKLKNIIHQYEETQSLKCIDPKLILNMVRNDKEVAEAFSLQLACEDLLGIHLEYLGNVTYNHQIRSFLKNGNLRLLSQNENVALIAQKLIENTSQGKKQWLKKGYRLVLQDKDNLMRQEEIICSVKCSVWHNCVYKRGGYPCRNKYVGFISIH
jgi:flagellar biosynthesis protein FlhG